MCSAILALPEVHLTRGGGIGAARAAMAAPLLSTYGSHASWPLILLRQANVFHCRETLANAFCAAKEWHVAVGGGATARNAP